MILIIGAQGSGKREYACQLGYKPEQMADAVLDERPVVYNAQQLLIEPYQPELLLPQLLSKQVVICNEVGSGVIPAERSQREWREACGRLSILLAQQAEQVIRMVCGIPLRIK
ncbi:MAG: bifunctional adenosylcobinamide kinase/adenosylcobinamide-phosphate guanylyltransferase [Bacillota bacterium]|nr:bifunctional adenosylcobinamide kinase/adenosylcobinamide-phosphate guanylyltransferase [Bacillota bacterium]